MLAAVEENGKSNRIMSSAVVRLCEKIDVLSNTLDKTQEKFVGEYEKFRRDVRELVCCFSFHYKQSYGKN